MSTEAEEAVMNEIARLRARLAEVRQVAVDFRSHYAGVLHPNAEALYHAVLQVIDREPLERSGEKGPGHG